MGLCACAFTGQRPKSFPWQYDETAHDCILLTVISKAVQWQLYDMLTKRAERAVCFTPYQEK